MKRTLFLVLLFAVFFNTVFCEDRKFSADAVVKIIVNCAIASTTEPYKILKQSSKAGSGFFFNDRGYILTNYHVISDAMVVEIRMPCFSQKEFLVTIKSVYPDLDLAILEMLPEDVEWVKDQTGFLPYLALGDSNIISIGDDVIVCGYPNCFDLKSMKADIRGFENGSLVTSAGNNPGNSGGPVIDCNGKVIGIHFRGEEKIENMAYAIPINAVRCVLEDMFSHRILYDPFLGVRMIKGDASLTEYYANPLPGSCYVAELCDTGIVFQAGIRKNDMIYKVDSYIVDERGRVRVPWRPNAITIFEYISEIPQGQSIEVTVYRSGQELSFHICIDRTKKPKGIHRTYQGFETIDYEIFGGFVVMELSVNIAEHFKNNKFSGIDKYIASRHQGKNLLIVTELFSTAPACRSHNIDYAAIIESINGRRVTTLEEYRQAIKDNIESKYIVFDLKHTRKAAGFRSIFVLPVDTISDNEPKIAKENFYVMTPFTQSIVSILQQKSDETKKTA